MAKCSRDHPARRNSVTLSLPAFADTSRFRTRAPGGGGHVHLMDPHDLPRRGAACRAPVGRRHPAFHLSATLDPGRKDRLRMTVEVSPRRRAALAQGARGRKRAGVVVTMLSCGPRWAIALIGLMLMSAWWLTRAVPATGDHGGEL